MAHEQKITVKIDVKKLVKSGFYQGEKGLYATLTIIPTPDNKYGDDYMVTQYLGREEKGPIIGNARDLVFDNDTKKKAVVEEEEEDVPF